MQSGISPRHVGAVPGDPGQVFAVGADGRSSYKVRLSKDGFYFGVVTGCRTIERNSYQGVYSLATTVVFTYRVDQPTGGVDL